MSVSRMLFSDDAGGLGGGFELAKPVNLSLVLMPFPLKAPFTSCWSFLLLDDQRDQ